MRKSTFALSAFAAVCIAAPSLAQELDVRVGSDHRDRDKEMSRAHGEYRPDRTIVVRHDRDHDRRSHHDRDHDHDRKVIIDR
jgi:hypothetical protein